MTIVRIPLQLGPLTTRDSNGASKGDDPSAALHAGYLQQQFSVGKFSLKIHSYIPLNGKSNTYQRLEYQHLSVEDSLLSFL